MNEAFAPIVREIYGHLERLNITEGLSSRILFEGERGRKLEISFIRHGTHFSVETEIQGKNAQTIVTYFQHKIEELLTI